MQSGILDARQGILPARQPAHGSMTYCGVVYIEIVGDLRHGVNTGLEGPHHGLPRDGVAAVGTVREVLGEQPPLDAWDFAQPCQRVGRHAVAFHERLTAE